MTGAPDLEPTPGVQPPRRGFGAAFWVAIIGGLILILAGMVIGFFGPRLFPVHPGARAADARPWLGNAPPPG